MTPNRVTWRSIPYACAVALHFLWSAIPSSAQVPPNHGEIKNYQGLHAAARHGDIATILELASSGADLEARDTAGRTPLHLAAFASREEAVQALAQAGAKLNALEHQAYNIVTIAAVANNLEILDLALSLGGNPGNITSPYDGTALIAAAHLGHHEIVLRLIDGGAPLDHVNNLGWTALMEAIVLGNGGPNHIETVRLLVSAGADKSIADPEGMSPLMHALERKYSAITALLKSAD